MKLKAGMNCIVIIKCVGEKYQQQKTQHALSSLFEIENIQQEKLSTRKN